MVPMLRRHRQTGHCAALVAGAVRAPPQRGRRSDLGTRPLAEMGFPVPVVVGRLITFFAVAGVGHF